MRSFEALFSADRVPERVEFTVDGQPCWVQLRPMGQRDLQTFNMVGLDWKLVQKAPDTAMEQEVVGIDLPKRSMFLVARTLEDYEWVRRQGDQWTLCRPPDDERQRLRHLEQELADADPAFWEFLVYECERVNGLLGPDRGNSPSSSGS